MSTQLRFLVVFGLLVASSATRCQAIDVTAVVAAGDAANLASQVVDATAPITVASANFNIDASSGGTTLSNLRAIGTFVNGNSVGQLPASNQPATGGPISYTGGIGISSGVCLSTGVVTDADTDGANAATGSGVGVEGPNNGFALTEYFGSSTTLNAGELSFMTNTPIDADFETQVVSVEPDDEGDAAVLQFAVTLTEAGFLHISFVFASDEAPYHIVQGIGNVNDSMAVFIRQESCSSPQFSNIAILKTPGQPDDPLSLLGLLTQAEHIVSTPPIFFRNQIAPAPATDLIGGGVLGNFPSSNHGYDVDENMLNEPVDGVSYYNHEFGGFSKVLTRETPKALAPGTYTIKIVVQDVFDRNVDSAVFVQAGSLKLFEIAKGDYNLDGTVDAADYLIWSNNFGESPATYDQGDGNGDCIVDAKDLTVWRNNLGATGNRDYPADFDRDGDVDMTDWDIVLEYYGLGGGASRFEGDADGDGDVDGDDFSILLSTSGSSSMMTLLTENNNPSAVILFAELQGLINAESTLLQQVLSALTAPVISQSIPEDPDVNGDGVINEEDFTVLDELLGVE